MNEYESFIYSFVKNAETVDKCAENIFAVYADFAKDTPKNEAETKNTANALVSSAVAKM